jgi:hypothetical protein
MSAPAFALVAGIFYSALGLLGMLSSLVMPAPESPSQLGYLFSLFAVSSVLNGAHLLIGAWGLAAWSGALSALTYARSLAGLTAAFALLGMIPGMSNAFGAMPLHGHNVWLHGLTAAFAAYIGFRSKAKLAISRKERRHSRPDRRHLAQRVALERRHRAYDRRDRGSLAAG